MRRRSLVALLAALMVMAMTLGATAAFAGEITGNGKSLKNADGTLNGRSECAFSGQEDNQFFNEDGTAVVPVVKGQPAHAQSWGQIPKEERDSFPAVFHPGNSCNPNGEPLPPPPPE